MFFLQQGGEEAAIKLKFHKKAPITALSNNRVSHFTIK